MKAVARRYGPARAKHEEEAHCCTVCQASNPRPLAAKQAHGGHAYVGLCAGQLQVQRNKPETKQVKGLLAHAGPCQQEEVSPAMAAPSAYALHRLHCLVETFCALQHRQQPSQLEHIKACSIETSAARTGHFRPTVPRKLEQKRRRGRTKYGGSATTTSKLPCRPAGMSSGFL